MPRESYESNLQTVREELQVLADMAAEAVSESVRILRDRRMDEGIALIERDIIINKKCHDIEEACLHLVATQQPVAGDLRFLFSAIQIAMQLERIADYGKGIARINAGMPAGPHVVPLLDIPRMSGVAVSMLREAIDAFLSQDADAAARIPARDVELDLLYSQVYRVLLTHVMQEPRRIDDALKLTFVAHNLERVGDRVVNICERVVYYLTGEVVDF
jgi:phosphate transport system protein